MSFCQRGQRASPCFGNCAADFLKRPKIIQVLTFLGWYLLSLIVPEVPGVYDLKGSFRPQSVVPASRSKFLAGGDLGLCSESRRRALLSIAYGEDLHLGPVSDGPPARINS